MPTFFFRAESFGSDPGSTGDVGLSGGKLLSWRDWISASLFNMETVQGPWIICYPDTSCPRNLYSQLNLAVRRKHGKNLAKNLCMRCDWRDIQASSFCAVKWRRLVAYCRLLVAIEQTGSPFFTSSIPTRPSSFNGRSKDLSMVLKVRKRFGKAGDVMSQATGQQESNNELEVLSFRRNAFGTEHWLPCDLAVPRPAWILT
jgi:hypothetical protein